MRPDDALRGLLIQQRAYHVAQRVIIISVDGLRPDAIGGLTPTIRRMARDGASARRAKTLSRSITLPSHVSMLTGVGVARHRIGFNSYKPGRKAQYPSLFRIARRAHLPTAMFVGKRKLEHAAHTEDLDRFEVGGSYCTLVNRKALPWLKTMSRGVAFIHYADPDGAGHTEGWMTPRYERAIHRADGCVEDMLQALGGESALRNTLIILTSDHGGHDRTHGSDRSEDVNIPWIAYGGAAATRRWVGEVHTTDTAATTLDALGLPQPHGIEGQPVHEALRPLLATWPRRPATER